ncbi:MAG: orotidine-5'-phosphate decarboxylase [Planctomycetota bacterium]
MTFVAELARRVLAGAAPAVVGLDPRLDALPLDLLPDAPAPERITAFYRQALPVLARHVPVVKPNIAFFECYGSAGFAAYEETCAVAREHGLLVLGDIKRGDIGSTAEAYAEGHARWADAVTLHPYLGGDSLQPFLRRCHPDRGGLGVFVLVRTSNPGARDLQDLRLDDGTRALCDAVADAVTRWGDELPQAEGYSPVGAVVGATWPEELVRLRARMPRAWILLPGVGAQGGKVRDLVAAFDGRGLGALATQSRGVMQAFAPDAPDWPARIEVAAAQFADECRDAQQLARQMRPGDHPASGSK